MGHGFGELCGVGEELRGNATEGDAQEEEELVQEEDVLVRDAAGEEEMENGAVRWTVRWRCQRA